MKASEITLKALMDFTKLTVNQAVNWLDHYNHKLRGSKILLLNNDRELSHTVHSGTLTGVNEQGEIAFTTSGGEKKTIKLDKKIVLLIFNKVNYVVFSD